ncbi:glycosyltransferase family 4 protein [Devosia chinhatensis]|uniref:Glycosyl transferase family 1 n=1 Tax=Devosia chinhatensis TaxID=429727 RepID=A0A0F5FJZ5_9HYPH|nr:glycosyltransferase family 4 protein [Devosia chinhatensis]KKB08905.1 glycosyl transferase family 1 [Devosia chinhatensis]
MKILVLSFYYTPDLSAGSFRMSALVDSLLDQLPPGAEIEIITTLPNRYISFSNDALQHERSGVVEIHRVALPAHKSGMVDQAKAFLSYAKGVMRLTRHKRYDLVYGTSSRLMTAALAALVSRLKRVPLYLDIRDIFVDTIKDVLPGRIARPLSPVFSLLEQWTVRRASKVNLVSEGFSGYFTARYPRSAFSYFTNGIDREFLNIPHSADVAPKPVATVLYAGNIGEGQGLHLVVPELARRLHGSHRFLIIGDGGRLALLREEVARLGVSNVDILPPVRRLQLIEAYRQADILFLHLNDHDAFKKVLPSKLFEYGATDKPIWAGLAGFSRSFCEQKLPNSAVFEPCNVDDAIAALQRISLASTPRPSFIAAYSRKAIMDQMATDVLATLARHSSV